MKVIFLKDVPRVGRKYDIKDVADGYAQNNLIPRNLAVAATPAAIARIEAGKAKVAGAQAETAERIAALSRTTEVEPLVIKARANAQGHLFEGVSAAMIADAIKKTHELSLSVRDIELKHPLKEVGQVQVPIRSGAAQGTCTIRIEAQ